MSLWIMGVIILVGVASVTSFKFMMTVILVENLKMVLLLAAYSTLVSGDRSPLMVLLVIMTMEAILSLVSLTRVWDADKLLY